MFTHKADRQVDEMSVTVGFVKVSRQILEIRSEPWIRCVAFRLPADMHVLEIRMRYDQFSSLLQLLRIWIAVLFDFFRKTVGTDNDCCILKFRFRNFHE